MNIVIIGNGPAGNTVASKLNAKGLNVKLFTNEDVNFYSRIKLPSGLGDREMLNSFCTKNNPPFILKGEVTSIDREKKTVLLGDGKTTEYDKLVIATGSDPINFFSKSKLEGLFTLRTYNDAVKITDELKSPVCVLGGGLLGLEAALEINRLNHHVTVVQGDAYVLNRQLNEEAAKIVAEKCLERESFNLICNQFASSVEGETRIEKLILQDKTVIECNTLVLAIGVKPSTFLAQNCGLKVNRGIEINEYCQTSDEDIYAIGDCAEYNNKVPGLMPIALSMANVCFNHILGNDIKYQEPVSLPTRFQVDGLIANTFGEMRGECLSKRVKERYEAWYIEENKVVGVILVGSNAHLPLAKSSLNKEVEDIDSLLDF